MGRRKSKRKPPPKHKSIAPLQQRFNCPFCARENSCSVKMDKVSYLGEVKCVVCDESFRTKINSLSIPVDVYNDWIDACEEVNP